MAVGNVLDSVACVRLVIPPHGVQVSSVLVGLRGGKFMLLNIHN